MNAKTIIAILSLLGIVALFLIAKDSPFESYIKHFYSLEDNSKKELKDAKLKLLKSSKDLNKCGFELVRFENEVSKAIEVTMATEGNQGIDISTSEYIDALVLRVKEHFSLHHEILRRACQ